MGARHRAGHVERVWLRGPPGTRPVATAVTAGQRVAGAWKRDDSEALGREALKAGAQISGGLRGLPSGALIRFVDGLGAYIDGETTNPAAMVFGYDRKGYEEAEP